MDAAALKQAGRQRREDVPLEAHAELRLAPDRDVVALLLEQATTRVPDLVPIRHGRMLASPFAFYRGAALPMAADLAGTPDSGLRVQLCGDAHVANFGAYASPERRYVFDLNDFDESIPGPFEWDVKRLAASMVVAARANGLGRRRAREAATESVRAYREWMRVFAKRPVLDVWYLQQNIEEAVQSLLRGRRTNRLRASREMLAAAVALFEKGRGRTSAQASRKLTSMVDGRRRIISDPPLIMPIEELVGPFQLGGEGEALEPFLLELFEAYRSTLRADRRELLSHFQLRHIAHKVVGVGSVGTRAWIMLLESEDYGTPLLLQAKQAQESALARYCGPSAYEHHGERVVRGQHAMQAASDIFLGWLRVPGRDGVPRDYYIRQLRDWKVSVELALLRPRNLLAYGRLCGGTLAKAHARLGDRIQIAGYLGGSDRFDQAVAEFAVAYADLTERDHAALADAVAAGRVEAVHGM